MMTKHDNVSLDDIRKRLQVADHTCDPTVHAADEVYDCALRVGLLGHYSADVSWLIAEVERLRWFEKQFTEDGAWLTSKVTSGQCRYCESNTDAFGIDLSFDAEHHRPDCEYIKHKRPV